MSAENNLTGAKIRLGLIGCLTVALLVWITLGKIDVVTHASGRIIPSEYVKIVQNLEGGIVSNINVKPGQSVSKDDILVQLAAIEYVGELESTNKRLGAMMARKSRLLAEMNGEYPNFSDSIGKKFPDLISSELREYDLRRSKKIQLEKFVDLAIAEYELVSTLRREGLESASELIRVERLLAERQQQLNDFLEAAAAEYSRVSNEIRSFEDSVDGLKDKVSRTSITAPVDGLIGRVFVTTTGGVVKPGEAIAEIVPLNDRLVIEANLLPQDIAFVYPNMPASIKVTAYDSSVYGAFSGQVDSISPDATTNDKGESFYQIRISSTEKKVDKNGNALILMPGMMAQIDLVTQTRTFLQYILKPFDSVSTNSFKER